VIAIDQLLVDLDVASRVYAGVVPGERKWEVK